MLVRSLVQLPEVSENDSIENGKFEISVPISAGASQYTSNSISLSTIRSYIKADAVNDVVEDYSLSAEDGKINISAEIAKLNKLSAENADLSGIKNFTDWPIVSADFPTQFDNYGQTDEYIIPNIKKVDDMILHSPVYMSTTSSYVAEGNPLPYNAVNAFDTVTVGQMSYEKTIGLGKHYFWQIDDGGTDSSQSIKDEASGSRDGYEEIRETGNLVMWGWLADQGSVDPELAWVGLFARMKAEGMDNTQMDIPLCIRPWIRGDKSASIMQYVGFNVPVRKGLQLKVKTGFPVYSGNSALNNKGSMVFMDRWIPNAFFGYVIK